VKLFDKSVLKPEGSIVAGIATVGLVYGLYQLNVGPMSQAQATPANHPVLESSRKKAGIQAFIVVAALTLIARDMNIGILGGGTIIAMEVAYRHGIMAHPESGKIENPNPATAYEPAQNVYSMPLQGQTG
jgi:hypothetical protein